MSTDFDTTCPYCGRVNEAHDGPTPGSMPKAGDVSICWACHGIALYEPTAFGLAVRKPTDAERTELDADPDIRQALAAMAESYTPAEANDLRWGQA